MFGESQNIFGRFQNYFAITQEVSTISLYISSLFAVDFILVLRGRQGDSKLVVMTFMHFLKIGNGICSSYEFFCFSAVRCQGQINVKYFLLCSLKSI